MNGERLDYVVGPIHSIFTMDDTDKTLHDAYVGVRGNKIVEVNTLEHVDLSSLRRRAKKVIDAQTCVLLPGFVDLYGHAGHSILKSIGEDLDDVEYRNFLDDVALRHADPNWFYVDAMLGAADRLRHGCTFAISSPGVAQARMGSTAYMRAVQDAFETLGMRARLVAAIGRAPWPQAHKSYSGQSWTVGFEESLDNIESCIAGAQSGPSNLVSFCVGQSRMGNMNPEDPVYNPVQEHYLRHQLDRLNSIMKTYDVGFYTNAYGNAIEYASEHVPSILGPKTILSHATGINERSINILAQTGTSVSHNPRARRLYRSPGHYCPVSELLASGVNVGIGSDGPGPDRSGDPFQTIRQAMSLERRRHSSTRALDARQGLELGTRNGYRALGVSDVMGTIAPGFLADFIVVDLFRVETWPIAKPLNQLIDFASGDAVRDVFVDGNHVVSDYAITTIEADDLLRRAEVELQTLKESRERGIAEVMSKLAQRLA